MLYRVTLIVALNIQTYSACRCVPCINSGICGSEKRNGPVADVHVCSVTLLPQKRTVTKVMFIQNYSDRGSLLHSINRDVYTVLSPFITVFSTSVIEGH